MNIYCLNDGIFQKVTVKEILNQGNFFATAVKLEIDVPKEINLENITFSCSSNVKFKKWSSYVDATPTIKLKSMKRWNRLIIRFPSINISSNILPFSNNLVENCQCLGETLKPIAGIILMFECFVCSKQYICECFRGIPEYHSNREQYDTVPYQNLLDKVPYRESTCHLCRGVPSTTGTKIQGRSEIYSFYGQYITCFAIGRQMSWHDAENYVRDRIGVPRIGEGWIAETNLLNIIRSLYPTYDVLHQASPEWLGRQRFDIFIPDLNLAIEYNGQQHYYPIEHFGGEEGFEKTRLRDKEKQNKAAKVGVSILEFRYDEDMTPAKVQKRIDEFLTLKN